MRLRLRAIRLSLMKAIVAVCPSLNRQIIHLDISSAGTLALLSRLQRIRLHTKRVEK
jgi:hypothetical protein